MQQLFNHPARQMLADKHLQLLHGSDIAALHVVLEALDLLLQLLHGDFVVLDDQVDLQLLDAEADGDELGATPDQTLLLDAADSLFESLHVGFVVCESLLERDSAHVEDRLCTYPKA